MPYVPTMSDHKLRKKQLVVSDPEHIYTTGNGEVLYCVELFGHSIYFYSAPMNVLSAEYHTNRNFILRGYQTIKEFLDFLDLPKSAYEDFYSDDYGWEQYTMGAAFDCQWIDFQHESALTKSGQPLVLITFYVKPYDCTEDDPYEAAWEEEMRQAKNRKEWRDE